MATPLPKLTAGAIEKIEKNEHVDRAILQIMLYKQMSQQSTQVKYRFQLSDGQQNGSNFIVVVPELIRKIEKGDFEKFTVVELTNYAINNGLQVGRQIIIINDMNALMAGSKIGHRLDSKDQSVGLLSNVTNNHNSNANIQSTRSDMNKPFNTSLPASSSKMNTSNGGNRANICPINAITPYFNAWLIKGRVTAKTNKRNWSNARGEGCVFSFDVTDSSDEIRVNGFNKECERFFDLIQLNKVYYISKGTVKSANKKFSNLANDYEISLTSDSIVEECTDVAVEDIPRMRYRFVQIRDLANVSLQSVVDVIAIIKTMEECTTIVSKKTNKEMTKRDIYLVDNTSYEVRFTLWNESAQEFTGQLNELIAIKGALVGDYNGRVLSAVQSTSYQIDPDIPEANIIREWYLRDGQNATTNALSRAGGDQGNKDKDWKYMCQINDQSITQDARIYFNSRAKIVQTGRQPLYRSCGQNGCMKKVMDCNNGLYRCDKCQSESPNFQWRLILSVVLSDCTGECWVTLFQEQAEKLLGITAQELSEIQERDPQDFLKALTTAEFKQYVFRIGSKVENFMEESRVKNTVFNFTPVDPIKHSKQLINNIKEWIP
ncbi:replication protein A 70 kDa DNA-binding subunit-like [Oppia nitens]|uniref:replication protein A 70 kDa DNA-binding subunit-like n=1 Tax=Oppia nitens TaxID=1686743 RepID=UPI0023DAD7BA|nr:replication protein A 70 kDa DNA-binding subunit-like [Oppia nitens]